MIFGKIPTPTESLGVELSSGLLKSVRLDPIWHHGDAFRRHQCLRANGTRNSFGYGNDARCLGQHEAVQPIEWKEHMSRDDQFRAWISPDSIGCQRIVTGHVRMNYLDIVLLDQPGKPAGTGGVQRVSQRQRRNVFPWSRKLVQQL